VDSSTSILLSKSILLSPLAISGSRGLSLIYRKAQVALNNSVSYERLFKSEYGKDILDPDIASQKTLLQIENARDDLAKKWNIVTRITQEDFFNALVEAEKNAG